MNVFDADMLDLRLRSTSERAGELRPRRDHELEEYAAQMLLDRLARDAERLDDLGVAQALGRQWGNPELRGRQSVSS